MREVQSTNCRRGPHGVTLGQRDAGILFGVQQIEQSVILGQELVARDLMLISVTAPPEKRPEIWSLVEMFRAKIVDIGPKFVMVEVSGPENKLEAFIEACRTYGIKSVVRTGTVAMPRVKRKHQVG